MNETYDLLSHTTLLQIVGEAVVRVDHALLGVPGARLEEVRRARSHWQALAQCEEFLASMRIEPVPVHDTAGAARHRSPSSPTRRGGGRERRRRHARNGLAVLAERIQTDKENLTKFAAIGTASPTSAPDKTSLVMAVLDEPGSLCLARSRSPPVGSTCTS